MSDQIQEYVKYLKAHGENPKDAEEYGAYLLSQEPKSTLSKLPGDVLKVAERVMDYPAGLIRTSVALSPMAQIAAAYNKKQPAANLGDIKQTLLGNAPGVGDYAEKVVNLPKEKMYFGQSIFNNPMVYTPKEALNEVGNPISQIGGSALVSLAAKMAKGPLKSIARGYALDHLSPTPLTKRVLGKARLNDVADEVLESGNIKFGQKAEDTFADLTDAVEEVGALKGDIVRASNKRLDPYEIADRFDKEVIEQYRGNSEMIDTVAALEKKKQDFLSTYAKDYGPNEISPLQMEELKTAAQKKVKPTGTSLENEAQMKSGSFYRDIGEEVITDPSFIPSKRAYGNLKAAKLMTDRAASLKDGGLMAHMTDVGVDATALAKLLEGNPLGLAAKVARGLTKGRTSSALATTANALSKGGMDAISAAAGAGGKIAIPLSVWSQIMNQEQK